MARPDAHESEAHDAPGRVRFDKWLWAARFYKTRTLAAQAIDNGHARLGGERVKPAQPVRVGDTISLRKQGLVWNAIVTGVSDRRGSATIAAGLYRESPESVAARESEQASRRAAYASRPAYPGRPTKRERRKLEDFLNEP